VIPFTKFTEEKRPMRKQMPLKKEIPKVDFRPLSFMAKKEGTKEIQTKEEKSKRGKGKVRRIEVRRTKAILIIVNYIFSTGPPPMSIKFFMDSPTFSPRA
jgi:hypothetical protein